MQQPIVNINVNSKLDSAANMWGSHAYYLAARMAHDTHIPRHHYHAGARQRLIDFSEAFTAWDRFDHAAAASLLKQHHSLASRFFCSQLEVIEYLANTDPKQAQTRILWHLLDLRNNASRKAKLGMFDDAMARVYRLIEWSAQWIIRESFGWETDDLPRDAIPKEIILSRNSRSGQWQAGLVSAWLLAARSDIDGVSEFIHREFETIVEFMNRRNYSILAHGDQPINSQHWDQISQWLDAQFMPMIMRLATTYAGSFTKQTSDFQLPITYPEELMV